MENKENQALADSIAAAERLLETMKEINGQYKRGELMLDEHIIELFRLPDIQTGLEWLLNTDKPDVSESDGEDEVEVKIFKKMSILFEILNYYGIRER